MAFSFNRCLLHFPCKSSSKMLYLKCCNGFCFLKGLVEVITSSDDHVSVRATILLGELLHMVNTTLCNYL